MSRKFKRFLSIMMVAVMVIAMAAACGKKEEKAAEPVEGEKVEAEKETEQAEAEENAADEQQAEETEAGEAVNEYGFTESQVQSLYDCIGEAVLEEYLQPNNITPSEFVWPDASRSIWEYLYDRLNLYQQEGPDGTVPAPTTDVDPKLSESLFIGVMNWIELPENGFEIDNPEKKGEYAIFARIMLQPASETIPANVTFTE